MTALVWIMGSVFLMRGRYLIPDGNREASAPCAPYRALVGVIYMAFGASAMVLAAVHA